jgi:hypothetical protein
MEAIKIAIYALCFLTSAGCSYLLLRSFARNRMNLLLWSGICFGFLAVNNLMVMFDALVFPDIDLRMLRHAASLAAVTTLLIGLVWEAE